jgi:hypothetical protein
MIVRPGVDVAVRPRPSDQLRNEALGRVLASLRESQAVACARHLDWWPSLDRAEWHIEWQEGPYAREVAVALFRDAADPDAPSELRGALTSSHFEIVSDYRVRFEVLGVAIVLRVLDPVGADEAERRSFQQLADSWQRQQRDEPKTP